MCLGAVELVRQPLLPGTQQFDFSGANLPSDSSVIAKSRGAHVQSLPMSIERAVGDRTWQASSFVDQRRNIPPLHASSVARQPWPRLINSTFTYRRTNLVPSTEFDFYLMFIFAWGSPGYISEVLPIFTTNLNGTFA